MEEHVLVFPARLLEEAGPFEGFSSEVDRYLPAFLNPDHLRYMPRGLAEEDPSHKQLIPYVVLQCGPRIFCYVRGRKGGEQRLHDRYSLGIGGHICREDGNDGRAAYEVGFERELAEEVIIQGEYRQRIVGVVYDPSTPVGAVHVGIVHLMELDSLNVIARDPALADGGFRSIDEIVADRDRFESWSTLVIDHVLQGERVAR